MKAVWLSLALALSSVIALEVTGYRPLHQDIEPKPSVEAKSQEPVLNILQPAVLEDIDSILERPLFIASRRPISPPAPETTSRTEPSGASDVLELIGTMQADGVSFVLFRHREQGMLRRQAGQDIEGWQVEQIQRERALLSRDGSHEWLALKKQNLPLPSPSNHMVLTATKAEETK